MYLTINSEMTVNDTNLDRMVQIYFKMAPYNSPGCGNK